eukprot:4371-Heterococcus_DN1.PRE.3
MASLMMYVAFTKATCAAQLSIMFSCSSFIQAVVAVPYFSNTVINCIKWQSTRARLCTSANVSNTFICTRKSLFARVTGSSTAAWSDLLAAYHCCHAAVVAMSLRPHYHNCSVPPAVKL